VFSRAGSSSGAEDLAFVDIWDPRECWDLEDLGRFFMILEILLSLAKKEEIIQMFYFSLSSSDLI